MKRFLLVSVILLSSVLVFAMFFQPLEGVTSVTIDVAPVRASYPDGRILSVLNKNTDVNVSGLSGDIRGEWLDIEVKIDGKAVNGFIDPRFTSYQSDRKSGRVHPPGYLIKKKK